MNKKLLLLLITGICILIWLVNNFSSRLNSLEERVLLNNNMIGEVYNILQKQDTMVNIQTALPAYSTGRWRFDTK